MKKNKFSILAVVLVAGLSSSLSFAASSGSTGWSFEGDVGFFSASTSGGLGADGSNLSGLGYGLGVNYALDPTWEGGLEFITSSKSTSGSILGYTYSVSSRITRYMANFMYHLPGDLSAIRVGVKLGLATNSSSGEGTATIITAPTTTSFAYGLTAGYDYMIGASGLSVGPKVDFVMIAADSTITNFDALLAIKYHL